MSQHPTQQARGIREEKYVATKEFPIMNEIAKDSKKFCRNRENFVLTELIGWKANVCRNKENYVTINS